MEKKKIYVGCCILATIVPTFFLPLCYPCILLQFLILIADTLVWSR